MSNHGKTNPRAARSQPSSETIRSSIAKKLAAKDLKIKLQQLRIEELTRENASFRAQRRSSETLLKEKLNQLEVELGKTKALLEEANKQLNWFRRNHFQKTSEKDVVDFGSASRNTDVDAKPKTTRPGGNPRSQRTEVETSIEFLSDECTCPDCGKFFKLLDKTEPSSLIELEMLLTRVIYLRHMYVSACDCRGKKIHVAPPPPKLFPKTEIGNSIWIKLIVQKFLHGVPVNRTLKELSLLGLPLAPGTVTGGFKVINELLEPLYAEVTAYGQGASFWNADETHWRVFDENKQRWWMWLISSDQAVVYLLDQTRSAKVPANFFAGSEGVLMTDRLASYKSLQSSIQKVWCWVHVRRDFLNIFNGIPQLKPWARGWLQLITELFVLEHKRFQLWKADKTADESWTKSNTALELQLEKILERLNADMRRADLHKHQSKVLRSLKRHWPGLTLFLTDPRIPLHNNRAERLLRNAVVLRKNSFGSGTEWAGRLCAKVFSLFQTWLINGLDPQSLLKHYFDECAKNAGKPPPDLNLFLPWSMSETQKQRFALPDDYKRPG